MQGLFSPRVQFCRSEVLIPLNTRISKYFLFNNKFCNSCSYITFNMISVDTFPGLSKYVHIVWASKVSLTGGQGSFGTYCPMWWVWNGEIQTDIFLLYPAKIMFSHTVKKSNQTKKYQTHKSQRRKNSTKERWVPYRLIWEYINIYDNFGNTKNKYLKHKWQLNWSFFTEED